jgi:4-hydroxy-3-methylbut-2-enyl diphosphate reductase
MRILVAKTAGFCMGVRRAVEMALDAPSKHAEPIYTYGPLIHNPQVLELFEEKGISVLDAIPDQGEGTVLVRAHGVPPRTKQALKKAGFNVIDATCPRVIKVQTIIRMHAKKGYASIIVGDKDHPEVIGLLGYAGEKGHVVGTHAELVALPVFDRAIVVAQTTQNTSFFREIKAWCETQRPHYKVFDTICDSTEKRQQEVDRMSRQVDAIVVVGGHTSGNTRRLAEIVRQTGKPAYHVETEAELDLDALGKKRRIGITAGASTPNWVTKRIFRTIEAIPTKRSVGWRGLFFKIQRTLLLTNIYVALGAGCLGYAGTILQGLKPDALLTLIAFLYVLAMHTLNHLTGTQADRYNDPDRAGFYRRNRTGLTLLALSAGASGLLAAYAIGPLPFLALLAMSILGLSYNLTLLPEGLKDRFKYRRIRDLPGSKTILIAVAWGIVTSIFPALAVTGKIGFSSLLVFVWSMCVVFVRTAFFDVLDMQGDRIVGKETIAVLLGEKRSMHLLMSLMLVGLALLPLGCALQLISPLGILLVAGPLLTMLILKAYGQGYLLPGVQLEFLVDTPFPVTGLIALLWSLVTGI